MSLRSLLVITMSCATAWLLATGCTNHAKSNNALTAESPVAACEGPSTGFNRDECYRKQATSTGKRGYCLLLKEPHAQARCIVESGDGTAKAADCALAAQVWPESRCFADLARRAQDVTLCDQMKGLSARDSCIAEVAQQARKPQLCAGIKQPPRHDDCVKRIAELTNVVADCAPILNAHRRDECRMRLAGESAVGPEACAAVENPSQRDECYIRRVREPGHSPDLCEKVTLRKNLCWRMAAIASDPALCEHVGPNAASFARAACYDAVASQTPARGADVCSNIPEQAPKEMCWARLAKRQHDPTRCQAIGDRETADDCWADMATENANYCVNIKRAEQARNCALDNWLKATDPGVCGLLAPRSLQAACRAAAALRRH